jgi:HK97 family phage portal protein
MNMLPAIFRRRSKAVGAVAPAGSAWANVFTYRPRGDVWTGSWQRNIRISTDETLRHHAVFACMSQIAGDIGKMRPHLRQQSANGRYWTETSSAAFSPVLSSPNNYQDTGQFLESWLWAKLATGNFYGLKVRDGRGVVTAIYPLDPMRVLPLVSTDGNVQVFYQLSVDNMAGITEAVVAPAREIIHDRSNTIHHPLMGTSPLYAASYAAAGGIAMAASSARFFQRGAKLSGVLTGPGTIDPSTAKRLEDQWAEEFEGDHNAGKVAVLGSGLKFETMQMSMVEAAVAEQMKWSANQICSVFGMPPWKIGLDVWPRGVVDVAALSTDYLTSCLQRYVESIERCLTVGLSLPSGYKAALDETGLLRMAPASLVTMLAQAVGSAQMTPNEARERLDLPPMPGGDALFLQQQNYSLEALAKRDAMDNPFAANAPPAPAHVPPAPKEPEPAA